MAKKKSSTRKKPAAARKRTKKTSSRSSTAKRSTKKTTKKSSKKTTKKSKKKTSARSKTTKKPSSKKTPAKKTTKKKTSGAKATSKKRVTKKAPAKSSKKAASKKITKKTSKSTRKSTGKATDSSTQSKGSGSAASNKKVVRKGITIVSQRPSRKTKPKSAPASYAHLGATASWGGLGGKPLIPSGPKAKRAAATEDAAQDNGKKKSPFNKRQLNKYEKLLRAKRAELVGDVSTIESEALKGDGGSLSHMPQHMAEQGSDAYDQSLSLDLAAADRELIKEIDAALTRIREGSYGVCEHTGRPIRPERLEELPWARYSIDAARALERRSSGM